MTGFERTSPIWFRLVTAVLILWGLMGCYSCYMQVRLGPDSWPDATDWDRAFYAAIPVWYNAVFIVAVGCGLFGALALLARSVLSIPLFVISLVAVIVMFGWTFLATDLIAHKGMLVATGFPIVIVVVAGFQVWFVRHARTRGWIG